MERQRRRVWMQRSTDILTLALTDERLLLLAAKHDLLRWDRSAQLRFQTFFGTTQPEARRHVLDAVNRVLRLNARYSRRNFAPANPSKPGRVAYVHKNDPNTIYLDAEWFKLKALGMDCRAGSVLHEMTHLVANTTDVVYGTRGALRLARTNPAQALNNADN